MSKPCPIYIGLKMARIAADLSQDKLAEAIEITRPQVANVENARTNPSWVVVCNWCVACGYRVSEVAAMSEHAGEVRRS